MRRLKSLNGALLIFAGAVWLETAGAGGWVRELLLGVVGLVVASTGVAALLFPGDRRIPAFAAFGAGSGVLLALLGSVLFSFGTTVYLLGAAVLAWVAAGRLSLSWVPPTSGVPERVDDLRLVAKVAIDEALLGSFHLRLHFPSGDALVERARETLAFRDWLRSQDLESPLDYHRSPPPFSDVEIDSGKVLGRSYEHLSAESGWEPLAEEPGRKAWLAGVANRTAHAYVVRTDPSAPWLVAINGYRMGMAATDLAVFDPRTYCDRLGLNLLIPVLPLHGPRRVGRLSGDRFLDGDPVTFVHAEAQAIWDIRRWVQWVRAQGAPRVGAMGVSLGGYNCALLAAVEDGLSCAIAGIPVVDFSRILSAHGPSEFLREFAANGIDDEVLDEMLRVVSPLASAPRIPTSGLAVFAGVADRVVPPEHQRDLIAHWRPSVHRWYSGGHVTYRLEPSVGVMVADVLRANLFGPGDGALA